MHNFRKLQIWTEGMALARDIYQILDSMPNWERYGLVSQLGRCAISVPSNIAEGSSRSSKKEFVHFLKIALGSCFEIETQIILACDLGYIVKTQGEDIIEKVILQQKRIVTFIKTLEQETRK